MSVVVVGDSQCGKTQLINRFANGAFDQVNPPSPSSTKFPQCMIYDGVAVLWYYYVHRSPPRVY